MKKVLTLNSLLAAVPLVLAGRYILGFSDLSIFLLSCLAIIPLAKWLGVATEHIALRAGEGIGGLLNATFGNAAELIIAVVALSRGLTDVVKASLTGSILGNVLLVMGASFIAGGVKRSEQHFTVAAVHSQVSMLMLAAVSLIIPALFHYLGTSGVVTLPGVVIERNLSLDISLILLMVYVLSLLFSLKTHRELFNVPLDPDIKDGEHKTAWPLAQAVSILLLSTVLVAWMSELLVGSLETAARTLGMTDLFIGIVIVAIVGNAAEHSTAVVMAVRNKMQLSLGIAIGSSTQIALFVAPLLVLLSYAIAPQPLDLVFTISEVIAVTLSVVIASQVTGDGKSNWFEGVQLLAVYLILAVMFYFMPG